MTDYSYERPRRNPWVIPVTVGIIALAIVLVTAIIVNGDDSSDSSPTTTVTEPTTAPDGESSGDGAPAENPCSSFTETSEEPFQLCDSGPAVETIQSLLNDQGFPVDVDGYYGRDTEAAVIAFQQSRGLEADGIVGPDTNAALNDLGD